MIEGFWQIGKEILGDNLQLNDFVDSLVLDVDKEKNGKKQHIIILKIKQGSGAWNLKIDVKEISDNTSKEYLWVGNPPGANSPQDRLTTNNLEYLVSQTIPNLISKLQDCVLKEKLKELRNSIYFDLGDKAEFGSEETQYERYRWIWDLSKFGFELSPLEIKESIKQVDPKKRAKSAIKLVTEKVFKLIKEKTKLKKEEISLFTIVYNDEVLALNNDYKIYLSKRLIEDIFEDSLVGICHICNEKKEVTWNTTKFWFKFYMTDKIGFSSNLMGDKAFAKNYTLCKNCYKAMLTGESFIRNNLSSYLAGYSVYIVPLLHLNNELPIEKIEKWSEFFKGKFDAISSLEGWYAFQQNLEKYRYFENIQDVFSLNFLFGEKIQAAFKIYQLVQDVPPSRLDKLVEISFEVKKLGDKLFGEDRDWFLSLRTIPYLFPIGKTKSIRSKFILYFYNSLFSGLPIICTELINKFLKRLWEIRFDKEFDDIYFTHTVLKQCLLLKFLEKLDLLKEGGSMNMNEGIITEIDMAEELKEIIKEFGYSEVQLSLFLLGMVIAIIGREQYKKGDTKKSILNKLQFQGMSLNKIERLYNEVMEKMRQYRVLSEGEKTYCLSKLLYDRNKANWSFSPQENLFYILSGYSYRTYKSITSKKDNKYIENKEVENG